MFVWRSGLRGVEGFREVWGDPLHLLAAHLKTGVIVTDRLEARDLRGGGARWIRCLLSGSAFISMPGALDRGSWRVFSLRGVVCFCGWRLGSPGARRLRPFGSGPLGFGSRGLPPSQPRRIFSTETRGVAAPAARRPRRPAEETFLTRWLNVAALNRTSAELLLQTQRWRSHLLPPPSRVGLIY